MFLSVCCYGIHIYFYFILFHRFDDSHGSVNERESKGVKFCNCYCYLIFFSFFYITIIILYQFIYLSFIFSCISSHSTLVFQSDAIPEILKNMLLVMETTQVFHTADGFTRLWTITWDRIDAFLPDFRHHIFRSHPPCM